MLEGRTLAITRGGADAAEFARLAEAAGAEPMALPTIELVPRGGDIAGDFLAEARAYDPDYTVFMSSKAVRLLFESARASSREAELRLAVAGTAAVAVGPKTAASLRAEGVRVAHSPPERFSSVGVGEVFTRLGAAGRRALVPRSGASTPFLAQLLAKIGVEVREMRLYDVRASPDTPEWERFRAMLGRSEVDAVVFTSASSVRAFMEIAGRGGAGGGGPPPGLLKARVVSIGPFTSAELRKAGVGAVTAEVHTVAGAFGALRDALAGGR